MPIDTSRQTLIHEFTEQSQFLLSQSKVLVIGAGGLATTALSYLTMSGVGHITIVDFDHIEESNLHRQTLYTPLDIGKNKAQTAQAYLSLRAPDAKINAIDYRLDDDEMCDTMLQHDVVLDCTDKRAVSYQINDCAVSTKTPVVFANASEMSGQLFVMLPKEGEYTTFRTVWGDEPQTVSNNPLGVIGPIPGVMGSYQALEAIKLLTNFASINESMLLHLDFRTLSMQKIKV